MHRRLSIQSNPERSQWRPEWEACDSEEWEVLAEEVSEALEVLEEEVREVLAEPAGVKEAENQDSSLTR